MAFPPLRLKEALTLGGLSVRELATRTWKKMNENEILTRAAAVSFYAILAFIPFLGLTLTFVVQLLPDLTGLTHQETGIGNLTVNQLQSTLRQLFPPEVSDVIKDQIVRLQKETQEGPPLTLLTVGLAITLWLASSLFLAVIDAMNRIYRVHETRSLVKLRLTAMGMTVVQAIILIGSLLAIVAWPLEGKALGLSAGAAALGELVQVTVIFVMVLLSFALAFFVGPDADQRWEWITPGSLIGSIVFLAVSYAFRLYVADFANYSKTYGSLGGVMALAFWFWISSVVLLTAGQVNKVIEGASPLGKREGQKVDPTDAPDFAAMPVEPQKGGSPHQSQI
jgi:membrane protein